MFLGVGLMRPVVVVVSGVHEVQAAFVAGRFCRAIWRREKTSHAV